MVAQIREQPVAHLGGAAHHLLMRMEPIAPFLRFGIGHPHFLGRASQIRFGNPHGAELIIIGMGFFELAQLRAFQHQRPAVQGRKDPNQVEAVARGFQHHDVFGGGMFASPAFQLGQWHFVEHFLSPGFGRRAPAHYRGSETVGVSIQPNHALDTVCLIVHFTFGYAGGRKRVRRVHALRYAGRPPCRCFSPVLIHQNGD